MTDLESRIWIAAIALLLAISAVMGLRAVGVV